MDFPWISQFPMDFPWIFPMDFLQICGTTEATAHRRRVTLSSEDVRLVRRLRQSGPSRRLSWLRGLFGPVDVTLIRSIVYGIYILCYDIITRYIVSVYQLYVVYGRKCIYQLWN